MKTAREKRVLNAIFAQKFVKKMILILTTCIYQIWICNNSKP